MATVTTEFTGDSERYLRALSAAVNKTTELEGKLRRVGQAGKTSAKEASEAFGEGAVSRLTAYAAGMLSIGTAISTASNMWRTYIENAREAGKETEDAIKKSIAFLAIQEGGAKREAFEKASNLATRFGIKDRAVAFDTVQSLQSALGGDLEKGLEAAKSVFAATMAGMQLASAQELAVLGIPLGLSPQQTLNRAFVTGQLSTREPETIAGAAPGLGFFRGNVDLGFAAAGVISGAVAKNETETYLKAAGKALESANFSKDQFEAMQGMTGGLSRADIEQLSQLDVLKIYRAQLGEQVDLKAAYGTGVADQREAQSLMVMLNNFGQLMRFLEEIPKQAADPALLFKQRAAIEAELPEARKAREIDILRAQVKEAQALGKTGVAGQDLEREDLIRGLALRRLGREQGTLGLDIIDEQGRASVFGEMRARVAEGGVGSMFDLLREGMQSAMGALGLPAGERITADPFTARLEREKSAIRSELLGNDPAREIDQPVSSKVMTDSWGDVREALFGGYQPTKYSSGSYYDIMDKGSPHDTPLGQMGVSADEVEDNARSLNWIQKHYPDDSPATVGASLLGISRDKLTRDGIQDGEAPVIAKLDQMIATLQEVVKNTAATAGNTRGTPMRVGRNEGQ